MLLKVKEAIRKFKLSRSLRVRLFLIILLMGMVPGVCMRFAIMGNYEDKAVALRTTTVQTQLKIIANHLITYNYLQDNSSEVVGAELDMFSNLYDGRVLIIGSNFKVVKDTYGISEGKIIISEEVMRSFGGESLSNYDDRHGYIEMTTPITETIKVMTESGEKEESVVRGVMLTSVSTDNIIDTMDVLSSKSWTMLALMLIIILAIALVLSTMLTRPFARITQAINEVKAGYSNNPISVPDYLETEHIVDAFNQLLGRMKVLDDSRQEFVANVSHELKTPMASMKVLADSLMMQPDAPVEMYREFMGDITEEIDRENRIITDLLTLVKLDKTVSDLNITTVNINELAELICKRLRPIARKKNIEVVLESIRPITAEVDEVKMTLVMSNLVENAIKYNQDHGSVNVKLDADHQMFSMEVSDTGIGIPEASLEHIYERFYRVDKSHSREIGGTGLGLAITRNVVLMHRGSITVSSLEGEGTVFLVKIPLNHIVEGKGVE
ncbi:MAG: two-component sensor histidine kinase [Lachnospiraceae bacterium]|nr:two-component sensor histidine kinase [Lachnospiraceae bacterium]MBQ9136206.1 two-component sensor histidine kinase [Lachnospiraceae bacterium]